jgi:2'-5' RNA ligase
MSILGITTPHETARLLGEIKTPGKREPIEHFHITLFYFGDAIPIEEVAKVVVSTYGITSKTKPFTAKVRKVITFANGDSGVPIVCKVESSELQDLRESLAKAFDKAGIEYSKKFPVFKPHVTLAYSDDPKDEGLEIPCPNVEWGIGEVILWGGDEGDERVSATFPLSILSKEALHRAFVKISLKKVLDMGISERVAARHIKQADLQVGRTFYSGSIRIHRYAGSIQVTDMTNAGKRGKRVLQLNVLPRYSGSSEEIMALLDTVSEVLVRLDTTEQVEKALTAYGQRFNVTKSVLRGVDVEPVGTKFTIKTNTGLYITSSPHDFMVLNSQPMTHPKTGEPMGTFQDTNYFPRKKPDAIVFYAWLKDNLAKANNLDMNGLRKVWDSLGVQYDSQ